MALPKVNQVEYSVELPLSKIEVTYHPFTVKEQKMLLTALEEGSATRKLNQIKDIRLQKLQQTDYMANSDYTMPDYIKTWRQSLRDIPANNDSSKYDDLLKRDDNGNLTHTIWTQPTE